jgi:hypothetical protein
MPTVTVGQENSSDIEIHDATLTVVEGGPHAIPWTHAARVNTALLGFIRS